MSDITLNLKSREIHFNGQVYTACCEVEGQLLSEVTAVFSPQLGFTAQLLESLNFNRFSLKGVLRKQIDGSFLFVANSLPRAN